MRRKRLKLSVRENGKTFESESIRNRKKIVDLPNKDGFFDAVCKSGESKVRNKKYDYLDGGTF